MDPIHGWFDTTSEAEARALAAEKKAEGLRVTLSIKPRYQGLQIYPHRVSWRPR